MSCCRSPHCWPRDGISGGHLFMAKLNVRELFDPSMLEPPVLETPQLAARSSAALQSPSVSLPALSAALSQALLARSTGNQLETEMNLIVRWNCFSNTISCTIIITGRDRVSFWSLQINKTTSSRSFGFPLSGKPSFLWCPWIETSLERQAES